MLLCSYYWFVSGIMSKLHIMGPISSFRKIKNPHLQCVGWNPVLSANYFSNFRYLFAEIFPHLIFQKIIYQNISGHLISYSKVGRREAAAARLGLSKRKKKKEKLDIEEVFYILNETHKD